MDMARYSTRFLLSLLLLFVSHVWVSPAWAASGYLWWDCCGFYESISVPLDTFCRNINANAAGVAASPTVGAGTFWNCKAETVSCGISAVYEIDGDIGVDFSATNNRECENYPAGGGPSTTDHHYGARGRLMGLREGEAGASMNNSCNPVNITTGNKFLAEQDYQGLGLFPLEITRYYNSQDPLIRFQKSPHWRISYTQHLIPDIPNTFPPATVVTRADGRTMTFVQDKTEHWTPRANNINYGLTAIKTDEITTGWALTSTQENWREEYDVAGNLRKVIDLTSGLEHVVTRSASSLMITHTNGQHITIEFDGIIDLPKGDREYLKLTRLITPLGEYQYDYDPDSPSLARLMRVIYPHTVPTDPNEPFTPPTRHYAYAENSGQLIGVTDESGQQYRRIEYDADGRVSSSGLGESGSVEKLSFVYDPDQHSTAVTNTAGLTTKYRYTGDTIGGAPAVSPAGSNKRIVGVEGEASTHCLATAKNLLYDDSGRLRYAQDARGFWTETIYNKRGLLEKTRTGLLENDGEYQPSADTQVVDTQWHPTLALPLTRTYSGLENDSTVTPYRSQTWNYTPEGRISGMIMTDLSASNAPSRTWTYQYTYHDAASYFHIFL
ncbi:MAG: DUF6531 domain-containing protein [Gammaproteobacteria bacterium]